MTADVPMTSALIYYYSGTKELLYMRHYDGIIWLFHIFDGL